MRPERVVDDPKFSIVTTHDADDVFMRRAWLPLRFVVLSNDAPVGKAPLKCPTIPEAVPHSNPQHPVSAIKMRSKGIAFQKLGFGFHSKSE